MKKIFILSVTLLIIGLLILGGCGQQAPAPAPSEPAAPAPSAPADTPEPAEPKADWPPLLGFMTTGEGHGSYAYVLAANQLITKYVDGVTAREIVVASPPAALRQLAAGDGPLLLAPSGISYLTNRGLGDFEQIPLNLMFTGDKIYQALFVLKDSGINSFGDLKGKTIVAEMPPAPGHIASFMGAVEAYGLTENDLTILAGLGFSEMIRPVIEGMADGVHLAGQVPVGAALELSTLRDVKVIGIDEDKMPAALEGAAARGWFFNHLVLPANSYEGQPEAKNVTGSFSSYAVCPTVDPDLVYAIMQALFDNEEEFKSLQPPGGIKITLETALDDMTTPYHPGAVRYYRERGVWTAEHDAIQEALLDEFGPAFAPHGS